MPAPRTLKLAGAGAAGRAMRRDDAVLLLHGQPGSALDWERVQVAIGSRLDTIALDRPGWNGRGAPLGLAGNARAALAALDAVGVERATVVGHSFGGAVATVLALEHPQRVRALVLAAPAANVASLQPLDYLFATPVIGGLVSSGLLGTAGAALATGPLRRRIGARLSLDDRYLRAAGRALISPSRWRTFAIEQRVLVRELPSLEARLDLVSAPTTIAIGTGDLIVPVHSARRLAMQIPGAELVELERGSHLLPQLRAAQLAEIIVGAARAG